MTTTRARHPFAAALLAAALAPLPLAAQEPPDTFGEEVVVRERSVTAVPPGSGRNVPEIDAVSVTVDGVPRRVTRVEKIFENKRGDWRFLVYVDPALAGARSRYLAALALAARAEELAALGSVEIVVADAAKPALARTDSWQRIEAALLEQALQARYRLDRGDPATARPDRETFERQLGRLVTSLGDYTGTSSRVLLLLSDGLPAAADVEIVGRAARSLAAAGWVTLPVAWNEAPQEAATARLSEFESWKQGAEGRDTSAGTRRYVIDLGRVFQRLAGSAAPSSPPPAELDPRLVVLQNLASPTSGRLVSRDAELAAALGGLARRWRLWFEAVPEGDGQPKPLEVRLRQERLDAALWILPAAAR